MSRIAAVLGKDEDDLLATMVKRMVVRGPCKQVTVQGKDFCLGSLENPLPGDPPIETMVMDGYLHPPAKTETQVPEHSSEVESDLEDLHNSTSRTKVKVNGGEFAVAGKMAGSDLLAARDPLGVKPLYYAVGKEAIFAASEIKALLHMGSVPKALPPGSYLHREEGIVPYYKVPEVEENRSIGLTDAIDRLKSQLYDAVKEKTGDIPWGVYLSGGLDSSIVACLAAQAVNTPVKTFTVGIKNSEDVEKAREVSSLIGSEHHEYIYGEEEVLKVLEDVIFHLESFDCAYVRSSIPNFLAAKLARQKGLKLMLSGEGSDEIFAGYSYLKELSRKKEIRAELFKLVNGLHHTGLQRVDRMNAAHGLECRLPYLKPTLVEFVMTLPLEWKLSESSQHLKDKWILRKAFEDHLGYDLAWREKQQFDQGAGSSNLMERIADEFISDKEYYKEAVSGSAPVRNKEELLYYRIFRKHFPAEVIPLVGRWVSTA